MPETTQVAGPLVCVDVDNTIADTLASLRTAFPFAGADETDFTPWGATQAYFASPDGILTLWKAPPFPGAAPFLRALGRTRRLLYLTARPPEAEAMTYRWLARHGFPEAPVRATGDDDAKCKALRELRPRLLYDDNVRILIEAMLLGVPYAVHDRPWNRRVSGPRILAWTQCPLLPRAIPA